MKISSMLMLVLLVLAGGCAATSGAARAPAAGGFVTLTDSAGAPVRAYAAGPDDAKAGVLVVHDYFGISDFTRSAADRLAALGYRVVAIDLYYNQSAKTDAAASELMKAFQAQDRGLSDRTLQAGLDALKRPGRKLATLGFSMGGIEALQANLNDPQAVQATAIVYGFGFDQLGAPRLSRLRSPLLTVTGGLDDGSLQASLGLMKQAHDLHQALQAVVVPDVGHAYAQPLFQGGKGYSEQATAATWSAIDEFFAQRLAPKP
jgi:carboxymethylenebutenolidase